MCRAFRLLALALCTLFPSLPATADAPEGWSEDEKFMLLGREAYQTKDAGLLALVDRVPAPFAFEESWFKKYVEKKLSKYTLQTLEGPFPIIDDVTGPVEGGYFIFTASKNKEGKLVLITYGVLIQDEAQVWEIFWNNSNSKQNTKLVVQAFEFLADGGSKDDPPEATGNLDQLLAVLGKDSEPAQALKPKAKSPPSRVKPYVAAPGQGVRPDQVRGVVFDFGKMKMKQVWVADMPMRIASWSGAAVYLVFKDGWAYRSPSVAPADLNVTESRRVEPKKWVRFDDVKLHTPTEMMAPLAKGTRIDVSVERPSTNASSSMAVRSNWKSLNLFADGRFETGSTSISSRQTSLDSSMAPSSNIVSSSDKDGSFSGISVGSVAGGGMIKSQSARRQSGNSGAHTGTYFIDGNTIELRYDDGTITRAVFGFDGEDEIIFGNTNYWVPKS